MTFIESYFDFYFKSVEKYGLNTIVLMQKGDFYEIYGVDNEKEKIGDMKKITSLLNIAKSYSDKYKSNRNTRANPEMSGFPLHSYSKYLQILLNAKYNVVMVEQTSPPPNTKREITRRHRPAITTVTTLITINHMITKDTQHSSNIDVKCHKNDYVDKRMFPNYKTKESGKPAQP